MAVDFYLDIPLAPTRGIDFIWSIFQTKTLTEIKFHPTESYRRHPGTKG